MKRKLLRVSSLALVLVMLVTACGKSETPKESEDTSSANGEVTEQVKNLTVAYNLEPASLDLQSVGLSSGGTTTGSFLFA